MVKQKHRDRGKQGLTVKKRAGRRTFGYQVPKDVAGRLPPGTTVTAVSLTKAEIDALARQVEPEVTRWLAEKPAKNALEALLLMVQAIYALLQPPELPIPHKEMIELAQLLVQSYDFAASWPYTREQLLAAMIPGHPDLRPDIPDEHILVVAEEVEKRLIVQMAEEGVVLRDPTQARMLVVMMTHNTLPQGEGPSWRPWLIGFRMRVSGFEHDEVPQPARLKLIGGRVEKTTIGEPVPAMLPAHARIEQAQASPLSLPAKPGLKRLRYLGTAGVVRATIPEANLSSQRQDSLPIDRCIQLRHGWRSLHSSKAVVLSLSPSISELGSTSEHHQQCVRSIIIRQSTGCRQTFRAQRLARHT
jgi:hypothetical protein